MSGPHKIILLALALAAFVSFDLIRTIGSGRAHGKFGVFTRKAQPQRFQRYLYGNWIVLALCLATILWSLISPQTFK
jgi:hypothetical protein